MLSMGGLSRIIAQWQVAQLLSFLSQPILFQASPSPIEEVFRRFASIAPGLLSISMLLQASVFQFIIALCALNILRYK